MNKELFRAELDQVRFTPAGRKALTDRLMQGLEDDAPPPRRRSWARRGLVIGLAAALLLGSAVASGWSIWGRFFGDLDEDQQSLLDALSQDLPPTECNGILMSPLAAFGVQDFYFLMLEIRFPESVTQPDRAGIIYGFDDLAKGESLTLTDGAGNPFSLVEYNCRWLPGADSRSLTAVIQLFSDGIVDFSDGTDKVLHIPGLITWDMESPENEGMEAKEDWSVTGSWDFNIGAAAGRVETREPEVSGVTAEGRDGGTMILDALRISPLGMRCLYHLGGEDFAELPGPEFAVVVMKDRSRVRGFGTVKWDDEQQQGEIIAPFECPIDLEKAAYVLWGTEKIPLH